MLRTELAIAAGVVVLGLMAARKAGQVLPGALSTAGAALDPTASTNLAYRGTSAVVSAATGRDETLGGWLWDVFNGDAFAQSAGLAPSSQATALATSTESTYGQGWWGGMTFDQAAGADMYDILGRP